MASVTTVPVFPCTIFYCIQGGGVTEANKDYSVDIYKSVDKLISWMLNTKATIMIENSITIILYAEDSEKNGYSYVQTLD